MRDAMTGRMSLGQVSSACRIGVRTGRLLARGSASTRTLLTTSMLARIQRASTDQKGDDDAKVATNAGIVLECKKLGGCTTMMSTRPKLLSARGVRRAARHPHMDVDFTM
jgi:hypothetical protein